MTVSTYYSPMSLNKKVGCMRTCQWNTGPQKSGQRWAELATIKGVKDSNVFGLNCTVLAISFLLSSVLHNLTATGRLVTELPKTEEGLQPKKYYLVVLDKLNAKNLKWLFWRVL